MRREADRDLGLDRGAQLVQVVGQIARGQRRALRRHAATDVDTDGGGGDRALHRHDRAHGRTLAEVHVGHDRDVREAPRQGGDVLELRERGRLDLLDARPQLDGDHLPLERCQ